MAIASVHRALRWTFTANANHVASKRATKSTKRDAVFVHLNVALSSTNVDAACVPSNMDTNWRHSAIVSSSHEHRNVPQTMIAPTASTAKQKRERARIRASRKSVASTLCAMQPDTFRSVNASPATPEIQTFNAVRFTSIAPKFDFRFHFIDFFCFFQFQITPTSVLTISRNRIWLSVVWPMAFKLKSISPIPVSMECCTWRDTVKMRRAVASSVYHQMVRHASKHSKCNSDHVV